MKAKFIVIIILVFLIILGSGITYYLVFNKDKPISNIEPQLHEVFVEYIDSITKKRISTNFTVISNKTIIVQDRSIEEGFKKIYVPLDVSLLEFYNHNPNYYTDFNGLIGFGKVSIDAHPIGKINVNHIGNFTAGQNALLINITTDGENRELSFCLAWSANVIEVENKIYYQTKVLSNKLDCLESGYIWQEYEEICNWLCKIKLKKKIVKEEGCSIKDIKTLPPLFEKDRIDRCYYSRKTITYKDPLLITLNYRTYPNITSEDFIKLFIYDSDNNLKNQYIFEDENNNDVGAKTIKYTIIS